MHVCTLLSTVSLYPRHTSRLIITRQVTQKNVRKWFFATRCMLQSSQILSNFIWHLHHTIYSKIFHVKTCTTKKTGFQLTSIFYCLSIITIALHFLFFTWTNNFWWTNLEKQDSLNKPTEIVNDQSSHQENK